MHDEFADWYGALWPRVLRAVTISVGDRDLAEEPTGEAFARALARWPGPAISYKGPEEWQEALLDIARSVRPVPADDPRLVSIWQDEPPADADD